MGINFKKLDTFWVVFISSMVIIIGFSIYWKNDEVKKLENTSFVLGKLKRKVLSNSKTGPYAIFSYTVNNEYFDVDIWGNFKDSSHAKYYCIEYSIEDPSVARLVHLDQCSE